MDEKNLDEQLQTAEGRQQYVRAAAIAQELGKDAESIRELRGKALWQMAAVYRNMQGSRLLAEQYGLSKIETEEMIRALIRTHGDAKNKALDPCYDHGTGKYLSFEEWLHVLLKNWDGLQKSEVSGQ